jgi:chromosomal replication initiator protein
MQKTDQLPKPNLSQSTASTDSYDLDDIWKIALENIRLYVSPRDFNSWFKPLLLEKVEAGLAEISCNQGFAREWIETYHRALIRKALKEATGQDLQVVITIRSAVRKMSEESSVDPSEVSLFNVPDSGQEEREKLAREARLNPRYLFTNFIVGAHNRLAHAVAEAVVESPGRSYNPVFYYGQTGVGKTHLMQAIGNDMLGKGKKVVYVSIEQFMNELIESIRTKTNEMFRKKYREIDLLIIDDIQFVETYQKTQEELFNTFNALYQANKQIILASDRPPREINNISDRLRSRFEGGMVADIQTPDYETRLAILRQLVVEGNIPVENDLLEMVAKSIESNVRELEGAVTKIISMKRIGTNVSEDDVAQMLQIDIDSKRRRIKPIRIIESVGEVFDVTPREIKGDRRTAYIALARQIAMYLLREELGLPLERVAKEVNRKDHTTVLHACEKIEDLLKKDERVKIKMEKCRELFL